MSFKCLSKLNNNAFQNLKFIELFPNFNEDNFTKPNPQLIQNVPLYNASTNSEMDLLCCLPEVKIIQLFMLCNKSCKFDTLLFPEQI